MTRQRRRLWIVLACGLSVGSASALTLSAFSSSLVFFLMPSDLVARAPAPGQVFRLGGLVQQGSVQKSTFDGSPDTQFRVTDGKASVEVTYLGILPDLFREGQGVVAIGDLTPGGTFRASDVLAKHDAAYMPKNVAEALEKRGLWNPGAGPPPPASTWNDLTVSTAAKTRAGS
jgi:cytochrome c-type biogenesis protein CcmE